MDFADTYGLWADSHVFYNNPIRRTADRDPIADKLAAWDARMANDTPNGELLVHNAMFDMLHADEQVSLLHVTHALEEINERGVLYPSGGCLVGSVYCTPLAKSDDGYRLHNLGSYVLTKEAPLAGRNGHTLAAPTPLVIDIRLPASAFRGLVGIDYLRLGAIHLGIYQHLEYLLARNERHQLRDTVVNRIKNAMAFLGTCVAACFDETRPDPGRFLDQLVHAVNQLPILGYIYFEVLAEYLMLHSTGPRATDLKRHGEFDNWLYKELLFGGFPTMAGKFDLARFRPSATDPHPPRSQGRPIPRPRPPHGLHRRQGRPAGLRAAAHPDPPHRRLEPAPVGVRRANPIRGATARPPHPSRTARLRPLPRLLLLLRPVQSAPGMELLEPHGHRATVQRRHPQRRDRHQPRLPLA